MAVPLQTAVLRKLHVRTASSSDNGALTTAPRLSDASLAYSTWAGGERKKHSRSVQTASMPTSSSCTRRGSGRSWNLLSLQR
eukprot:339090-Amphidinium_carterae.1